MVKKFLDEEKFDDGESGISAVTTKTTRGKALDKHCTTCDKKYLGLTGTSTSKTSTME
jgi:hypothetical protein